MSSFFEAAKKKARQAQEKARQLANNNCYGDHIDNLSEKNRNYREQAQNFSQNQFNKLSPERKEQINQGYNKAIQGFSNLKSFASNLTDPQKREEFKNNAFNTMNKRGGKTKKGKTKKGGRKSRKRKKSRKGRKIRK